MAFTTGTKAIPSDSGLRTIKHGNLLIRTVPTASPWEKARVVITNLNDGTAWAWEVESPADGYLFWSVSCPAVDPATGLVWFMGSNASSSTRYIKVSLDIATGEANYYPRGGTDAGGAPYEANGWTFVIGNYVVTCRNNRVIRFDKTTGEFQIGNTYNQANVRPILKGTTLYWATATSPAHLQKIDIASLSASHTATGASVAASNGSPIIEGDIAYYGNANGDALIRVDTATEAVTNIPVPSGFVGPSMVKGADGKFYSSRNDLIVCYDPVTFEVASTPAASVPASRFGFVFDDLVHFCVA